MFAFVALLAFAAPFFVRAIVSPLEPAPGDIEYQGSQCVVSWTGDPNSTTLWKGMAIELMTGNNLQMVHLTSNHSFFFCYIRFIFNNVLLPLLYSRCYKSRWYRRR